MTPEERLNAFRQFVEQRPADPAARYSLAMQLGSMERNEEAVREFRATLELDPGHVAALQQLGKLLARIGQKDEAMRVYEAGIAAAAKAKNDHAQRKLGKWLDALRGGGVSK